MGRANKIRRLPAELREQLNRMLDDGYTLDEITSCLKEQGADVSRSGIGRYAHQAEKMAERLRRGKEISAMLVARLGNDVDESRIGRTLVQAVNTLAQEYVLRRIDDPEADMEVDEIFQLAKLARAAGLAARANQDHEIKTREVVREEAADADGETGPASTGWDQAGSNDAGPA
jgi:hypothetical protein